MSEQRDPGAARRRRWGWGIGAGVVCAAVLATVLSLTSDGGGGEPGRQPLPRGAHVHVAARLDGAVQLVADTASPAPPAGTDPATVQRVAAAEQALGVALLRQVGSDGNASVSPASLYLALGMLQNGARGATAAQIARVLHVPGVSTADLNAGLAGLTRELTRAAAKDGITLDSANSLWQQRGFPLRAQFLAALAHYYRTGVWQVDYAHDMAGALHAIDTWTSRQTRGKITKLFDALDPQTVLVLADAIYFHAAWATPFSPAQTEDGVFTTR
jgi:serpin B